MNKSVRRIRRNGIARRASKKKMALGTFPKMFEYSSLGDLLRALVFRHTSETAFFAYYISYNHPHKKSPELKLLKLPAPRCAGSLPAPWYGECARCPCSK
jgi:hypothetical protein